METKLLDLNAYGVEEMSNVEMRETNGGIIGWIIGGAIVVGTIIDAIWDVDWLVTPADAVRALLNN